MNKTITPTPKMVKEEILKPEMLDKQWYVIDATDQRLGRLASEVANILRGKNKPIYTPH
ncbi:uL13 family ribosomal protein, partial [Crocosphaera watsonii]